MRTPHATGIQTFPVYGFNFNAMNEYSNKVYTDLTLNDRYFQGNTCCVLSLNLSSISLEELIDYLYEKRHPLTIFLKNKKEPINQDNDASKSKTEICQGLVTYFDFSFFHRIKEHRLTCSTRLPSHWQHTIFEFSRENVIDEADLISGTLKINRKQDCERNFDFTFNLEILDKDFNIIKNVNQTWCIS